jgi:hypothetical protein
MSRIGITSKFENFTLNQAKRYVMRAVESYLRCPKKIVA